MEVPTEIEQRAKHFKRSASKYFGFLHEFGFSDPINGKVFRAETFLDYKCSIGFSNSYVNLKINYSTDIINGMTAAFPKDAGKLVIDNHVQVTISDDESHLIVSCFMEEMNPELGEDFIRISKGDDILFAEIERVLSNYSKYIFENMVDILSGKTMYKAYTNKEYDRIVEERKPAHNKT